MVERLFTRKTEFEIEILRPDAVTTSYTLPGCYLEIAGTNYDFQRRPTDKDYLKTNKLYTYHAHLPINIELRAEQLVRATPSYIEMLRKETTKKWMTQEGDALRIHANISITLKVEGHVLLPKNARSDERSFAVPVAIDSYIVSSVTDTDVTIENLETGEIFDYNVDGQTEHAHPKFHFDPWLMDPYVLQKEIDLNRLIKITAHITH